MRRHLAFLALSVASMVANAATSSRQGETRPRTPVPAPSPSMERLARISADLLRCSSIDNAEKRLRCYDALAGRGVARLEFSKTEEPTPKPTVSPLR